MAAGLESLNKEVPLINLNSYPLCGYSKRVADFT
jgi:hypothetical protein